MRQSLLMISIPRSLLGLGLALLLGTPLAAAPRTDVLLLVNGRHEGSAAVIERYRTRYEVPSEQVLTLAVPPGDQIARADYQATIQQPVATWLKRHAAQDRITYIVLGPGFPTRIAGTVGRSGTVASVDSELALLYRTLTGATPGIVGSVRNPYFTESPGEQGWPAFDRRAHDIYLVARLDAFTIDEALALADRCQATSAGGTFVLDDRLPLDVREHRWFAAAAERLTEALGADQVVFDRTLPAVQDEDDVMGFYGWGAADPGHRARPLSLRFRPGAIVASLSSTDARTFEPPPDAWRPGSWQTRDAYYKGSPEWLAADFIRAGVAGVVANVADPYADGAVRPDVLLPAYVAGRTLGEAAYLAIPSLSWQAVVIGDPLCAPFRRGPDEPAPTFTRHETSGLTQPFYDRVLAHALQQAAGIPRDAVEAMTAAFALVDQERRADAVRVLDALADSHPTYLPGLVLRGQTLEADGKPTEAIAAYRKALEAAPTDMVTLNNLAYLLLDEPDGLPEALTLSRRAYEAARGAAIVADTYGWVLFRSGETSQALRVLRDAVAREPRIAELRLHLARVLFASGELAEARQEWERALALDAGMRDHKHAGPLRDTFAGPSGA